MNNIRIFDYAKFAEPEPSRTSLKAKAEKLAKESGIEIGLVCGGSTRKESLIEKKLQERWCRTGFVHILSVMEGCTVISHGKTR